MRQFLALSILLFSFVGFAQQMHAKRIEKASFSEIESELYLKPYHLDSIQKWAGMKAQFDMNKGKRIMLYQQASFENACILCAKYQEGFQLIRFGSGEIPIPELDAFVSAYNEKQIGPAVVQAQYSGFQLSPEKIQATQTIVNDSMVRIQVSVPELESFFGVQSDQIQLEIQFLQPIQLPIKELAYPAIRSKGIVVKNKQLQALTIRLVFDLQRVGTLPEKCWCNLLEQRYFTELTLAAPTR